MIRTRLTGLAALAAALTLSACGGDGESRPPQATSGTTAPNAPDAPTTTAPAETIEVVVRGGSIEGGPTRRRVKVGDLVRIRVTSDVAEEIHVHGYEKRAHVTAGATAEVEFVADIPGVFEVELEGARRRLLTLEVQP